MARKRLTSRLHLLTVREVQTASDGDHSDGGGLILRVRDGSASWVFRYTSASGKRREMGLGVVHRGNATQSGKSVTDARDLAGDARKLLQQGVDPIDERMRKRGADRAAEAEAKAERERQMLTLARAARDYHERVIEPSRGAKHSAQWIMSLETHIPPAQWHAAIATITAPALLDTLLALRQQIPETAMRIRQRLEAVFEDAIFRGHCTTNPAAATRRKMREAQGKRDRGRFTALPFVEAPAFVVDLRTCEGIAARCLEFALLTASRTSEAIGAEWNEFDLEQGVWTIAKNRMKAGEPHAVYLASRALEIVNSQRGLDERFVFPTPTLNGKPLSNMAMLALLDRMKMRDRTTVHGLCRATFSTWAYETGAARPDVIEACLAHREIDKVKAAYNRAQFTVERRELLKAWADYLASPRAPATVLRLKTHRQEVRAQ